MNSVITIGLILTSGVLASELDSVGIRQARINNILLDYLDTIHVALDSSSYKNPFKLWNSEVRKHFELGLISDGFSFPPASAFFKGIDDATRDIMKGTFKLKFKGEMIIYTKIGSQSWLNGAVYAYNLQSKFGVFLEGLTSSRDWKWKELYIKGYNQVMTAVLNTYFECDIQQVANDLILDSIQKEGSKHHEWIYKE